MPGALEQYVKGREFLICIDSDGCAMDTMDIKHIQCFGPCLVDIWGLEAWREEVLCRWNEINLYSMTRGINRFQGLSKMLAEVDKNCKHIEGCERLTSWVNQASELSNSSVKQQWESTGDIIFEQALKWSEAVNHKIKMLPETDICSFPGVKAGVENAKKLGSVAIVSSANEKALVDEWEKQGLLSYVDLVLSQDAGTKSECIRELLKKGYAPDHVLMVGDAPGDCQAALENGVYYYPILVHREKESWERFSKEVLCRLEKGCYGGMYQEMVIKEFMDNLS